MSSTESLSSSSPSPPAPPAFVIYRGGNALLSRFDVLANGSTGVSSPGLGVPVIRLCAIDEEQLLLLDAEEHLLLGRCPAASKQLLLTSLRSNVIDVDICRSTRTVYVVTKSGCVYAQVVAGEVNHKHWQQLIFDPLELSEEGIRIARVKCSAQGVLFVTCTNEIYGLGNFGDVFQAEMQPQHMRLFEDRVEVLDLVAGDEHFALLLKPEGEDILDGSEILNRRCSNKAAPSNIRSSHLQLRLSPQKDLAAVPTDESIRKHKRTSSSAGNSICSQTSNSQNSEYNEEILQHILLQGHSLLKTQVHTFGSANSGILGTGDHVKRSSASNIQKLDGIGVFSIAAGREHTIVRTLDGRLFHWGLNSKQQLNGTRECIDISAPCELKLDSVELGPMEHSVLAACCGDYQTILLNAKGDLHTRDLRFNSNLLTLQPSSDDGGKIVFPLLLASGPYTLQNQPRPLVKQFFVHLNNLQLQFRAMLTHRAVVKTLQVLQQKNNFSTFRQLVYICHGFQKLLCYTAAALKSLESYYRGDLESPGDLIFIRYYKISIALFEDYIKAYCDVRSINGFVEVAKVLLHLQKTPLNSDSQDPVMDLDRVFQQPFQIFPTFVQSLELICKTRIEFTEPLLAWQAFTRQQCIDIELAEHTQDFWIRNERNVKLRQFRRKQRRVILSSETVPLRLASSALSIVPGSQTSFILFSDCLCQMGAQLQKFPLVAMWLKLENDKMLRVTTPDKTFTLVARSHHDKMLWYDQMESAIMTALGRPGAKMCSGRTMEYVFSDKHPKYPRVNAYGQWRNGVMHGNCYLQFPDERFYLGEMRNGEIEGYGKMVIPSIGFYEGTFRAGKFHGHGSYEMKDNEVYTGHFRDGVFHGHGMLRTNTYTYVGEFQANAKSGYGVLDDTITGDKYMGMFADNKRTGAGTCITMNGDYFEGIFVNDELSGQGIAVFENDYFYEGELSLQGPMGKGTYYMPNGSVECESSSSAYDDEPSNVQMVGNVLSGHLTGTWNDVRIVTGSMAINRQFPKFPKSIGDLVVDNSRKWRTLFDNFEEEVFGNYSTTESTTTVLNSTKELWSRIAVYMTTARDREKTREQQDSAYQSYVNSNFAKNISIGFSASLDKVSLKSTNSLMTNVKSSILDLSDDPARVGRRSYSQETLFECDLNDLDFMNSTTFPNNEDNSYHNMLNSQLGSWANDSSSSLRSSYDSVLNLSNNIQNSFSSQNGLDFVPNFGITSLTADDVAAIKEYLVQAFKNPHHPLHLLNQRIANSFYTSYGCWKVKPTPILAKQAMREWESISKRVYSFVHKMFPALPEEYCVIESTREVVSHITLLYPIVLSEGIYSTLFVLYANKYSGKDEMYRQNLMHAEKLKDAELSEYLGLDSVLLPVVSNEFFSIAIQTLKQLQEKYSPKAMLTVIEKCMQLITEAHKLTESGENSSLLAADSMMPLTLFLVLRAAVPHLGAELALLDDLTGGSKFEIEMNGFAGYCYTTLKASYEHITAAPLKKS